MKIKISADSTCDLSPELIEKYNIGITPLYINVDDKSFRDIEEINVDDLFGYVDAGATYGTAAVNLQDYLDVFSAWRKEYDAVIHFTISSDMSSCFQNAKIAASELENVYIIDSRNLSTGIGHLVLDAAEMAAAGLDAESIYTTLEEKKSKLDVSFVLYTLDYLRKGGRCSAVAAFGANLLKLRPCILVRDGKMGVGKKYRGDMTKCYVDYIKDMLSDTETLDLHRIFITDSGLDEDIRTLLEQTVRDCAPFEEIIHTRAGCTISGHCGPGCMGVLFYHK